MRPYYEDGTATIYLGDCREVLPGIQADVMVTDPPYGLGGDLSMSGFASRERFGIQTWDASVEIRDQVLALWGDRPAAVFGSPRKLDARPSYREVPLVWDKGDMVAMGDCSFPWRATYELIYISGPGWTGHRDPAILRHPHSSSVASQIGHPSVKPVWLMAALISKCAGIVVDPFMGSGSTLRAAKELHRAAIGIEIEERYCEIAAKRLAQEVLNFEVPA